MKRGTEIIIKEQQLMTALISDAGARGGSGTKPRDYAHIEEDYIRNFTPKIN